MFCRNCGTKLKGGGGDLCPDCLPTLGTNAEELAPTSEESAFTPRGLNLKDPKDLPLFEGKYQAIREAGRGGSGVVYEGLDVSLDRRVAIKILSPSTSHDPRVAKRFNHEARTLAALEHPNIVPIYSYGKQGRYHYFVMKYLDGVHLTEEALTLAGSFSGLVRRLWPIFDALHLAHGRGIIHRDLKPENVVFDTDGTPMLLDFGIALDAAQTRLTAGQGMLGTPAYISPEQAMNTEQLTPATDQYSLAVIFYELLAGELPFFSRSAMSMLYKQINEAPKPLIERNPAIPPALDRVILRALEKKPAERFADMLEFRQALEQALEAPVPATIPATPQIRAQGAATLAQASTLPGMPSGPARPRGANIPARQAPGSTAPGMPAPVSLGSLATAPNMPSSGLGGPTQQSEAQTVLGVPQSAVGSASPPDDETRKLSGLPPGWVGPEDQLDTAIGLRAGGSSRKMVLLVAGALGIGVLVALSAWLLTLPEERVPEAGKQGRTGAATSSSAAATGVREPPDAGPEAKGRKPDDVAGGRAEAAATPAVEQPAASRPVRTAPGVGKDSSTPGTPAREHKPARGGGPRGRFRL